MPMRFPLFAAPLLFFGYIFAEIAVFIYIGDKIGILPVLALVLLSAFLGAALLRSSKSRLLNTLSGALRSGHLQESEAGRRLLSLTAALLLIMPGFISSCLGLILALAPVQGALISRLKKSGAFQASFSVDGEMRKANGAKARGTNSESPVLDLKPENYHAAAPENSPWRKP